MLADEWVKALDDPKMWDQTAFNDLARKGHGSSSPPKNLWKGYMGELTVGVLPCALFASGHTFFVQVGMAACAQPGTGRAKPVKRMAIP